MTHVQCDQCDQSVELREAMNYFKLHYTGDLTDARMRALFVQGVELDFCSFECLSAALTTAEKA